MSKLGEIVDREVWGAAVRGVAKSQTRLSEQQWLQREASGRRPEIGGGGGGHSSKAAGLLQVRNLRCPAWGAVGLQRLVRWSPVLLMTFTTLLRK